MMRTFRYPLRPTRVQAKQLRSLLGVCCDLYNAALQERRDAWRVARKSVSRIDQTKELTEARKGDAELAGMAVEIQRSALRRVELAFTAFFRRCRLGETPGFPRFRSRERYDSFAFPSPRVTGNRVLVPRFGDVRFHRYRPLPCRPRNARISRDATGRWWVSFVCEMGSSPEKAAPVVCLGIDLGIAALATLSTGDRIENPRFLGRSESQLRSCHQSLDRKSRGSASHRRARVELTRAYTRVANRRLDFARKLACDLFRRADLIAFEDLQVANMARSRFARPIADAGWSIITKTLMSKAESAGKWAIPVDPKGTSQRCSGCGETVLKGIADRRHVCRCGVDLDRDHNAALNILALGRSAVEAEKSSAAETGGLKVSPRPIYAAQVEKVAERKAQTC